MDATQCACGTWYHVNKCALNPTGHSACRACRQAKLERARRYEKRKARKVSRSPVFGSAEWAETRSDDLGYSGDY